MTTANGGALEVRGLTVQFRGTAAPAVQGVSFILPAGQTLGIVGRSGSGKSVTAKALLGLLPASARVDGSVRLFGRELLGLSEQQARQYRGPGIAMVFQDPSRALNPVMRVGDQIAEAIRLHHVMSRREVRTRAIELLALVQLGDPRQRYLDYPHEMSGGMCQRAMIALALSCQPKILIADEATTALDVTTQASILEMLRDLREQLDMSMLLITHDLTLAAAHADETLVLQADHSSKQTDPASLGQTKVGERKAYFAAPHPPRPSKADSPVLLDVVHLVRAFPGRRRQPKTRAVSDVSLQVHRGETFALVGESGSGKSTLAKAILQMPPRQEGQVWFDGVELGGLDHRQLRLRLLEIQIVFQNPFTSLNPKWKVSAIVEEPLRIRGISTGPERRLIATKAMRQVGLDPEIHGNRRPRELSGGQVQQVALARALTLSPSLLILDEALSSLDSVAQADVLAVLEQLRDESGLAYLLIAHDLALVERIADSFAIMYLGKLCEVGPKDAMFAHPAHPYTAALLASIPTADLRAARVRVSELIRGEPGSSTNPPSGCRFRTRCPAASRRCAFDEPEMRSFGPDHHAACHHPLRPPTTSLSSEHPRAATTSIHSLVQSPEGPAL